MNRDIARAIGAPEIVAKLAAAGVEPVANSPQEFGTLLSNDLAKWGKVIRDANIRAN